MHDEQESAIPEQTDTELIWTEAAAPQNERAGIGDKPAGERPSPDLQAYIRRLNPEVMAYLGIIILGAVLRFWNLGSKPLQFDEGEQAYYALAFARDPSSYRYQPVIHGPFQYHVVGLIFRLAYLLHAPDNGVNNFTLLLLSVLLGITLVALPILLRRYLGRGGALATSLLLAVSPTFVYYSRDARNDIYVATFTLLTVVGVVLYAERHRLGWLILAAVALTLSYTAMENTFLTIAIFGSYLGAALVWDIGRGWGRGRSVPDVGDAAPRLSWQLLRHPGTALVALYFILLAILGKIGLNQMQALSVYIGSHQSQADQTVQALKHNTVAWLPIVGIIVALWALLMLALQLRREARNNSSLSLSERLAQRFDPSRQKALHTLACIPWVHWFLTLLVAFLVFATFFTIIPSGTMSLAQGFQQGIGDGLWQGLYYWIEQQAVARGGQPWFYYLLLIPLYEQLVVVFGLSGLVYALVRPTRFRIFLIYWFLGSAVLYSWAGEKMPWLAVHILLPLFLLAGVLCEAIFQTLLRVFPMQAPMAADPFWLATGGPLRRPGRIASASSIGGLVLGLLLLVPMVYGMLVLNYRDAADASREMMMYAQATPDLLTVMQRIDRLDQQVDGGQRRLRIGLTGNMMSFPLAWYLRDYANTYFNYPVAGGQPADVILVDSGSFDTFQRYHPQQYHAQEYSLLWWPDQGYDPPPCVPGRIKPCPASASVYPGVGPLLWLSYGDSPPRGARPNPALIVERIWTWLWTRKPLGNDPSVYTFYLLIRNGLA